MAKERRRRLTYYPTTTRIMMSSERCRREVLSPGGAILLLHRRFIFPFLLLLFCCFLVDVCSPFGGILDIVVTARHRHRQPRRSIGADNVVLDSSSVRNSRRRGPLALWGLSPSQEVGDTSTEEKQASSSSSSSSTSTVMQVAEDEKEGNSVDHSPSSIVKNSYRIVSDQDPKWFQNYVVNILGEDDKEVVLLAHDENKKLTTPRNGKTIKNGKNAVHISSTAEQAARTTSDDVDALLREIEEEAREYAVAASAGEEKDDEDTEPQKVNTIAGGGDNEPITSSLSESKDTSMDEAETTAKEDYTGFSVLRQQENITAIPTSTTTKGYEQVESPNTTTKSITNATTTIATPSAVAVPVEDDTEATLTVNQTTSTIIDKDEMVVLFREAFQQSWTRVPLAKFEALGYSNDDIYSCSNDDAISSLHPDALSLIVSESIRRPRSGIPSRWKLVRSGSSLDQGRSAAIVKLLSTSDADRFLKEIEEDKLSPSNKGKGEDREKRERTIRNKSTRGLDEEPELPTKNSGRPLSSRRRKQEIASSSEGSLEDPAVDRQSPRRKRRRDDGGRRTQYRDDGRLKPVYTGRHNSAIKRRVEVVDPPPPKGFWPDIDTFRDLLRKEARMRLSIMGDDWSDIVKQESDWRLDLYKSWLWTLHNGVGEPIVQSRSDRARRKRIGGVGGSAGLETASRPSKRRHDELERHGASSSSSSGNKGRERKRKEPQRQRRRRGD